jgi:hypothetical protein
MFYVFLVNNYMTTYGRLSLDLDFDKFSHHYSSEARKGIFRSILQYSENFASSASFCVTISLNTKPPLISQSSITSFPTSLKLFLEPHYPYIYIQPPHSTHHLFPVLPPCPA